MEASDKIYIEICHPFGNEFTEMIGFENRENSEDIEYIRKDALLELVKLTYGKVSMNPFDCSEAFEELINKIESI